MLEIHIVDQSLISIKKSNTKNEQVSDDPVTRRVIVQLGEYMEGRRKIFEIPLKSKGTPFQQAVWNVLAQIPYGQTRTYGEVSAMIGNPKAARAVGNALKKNPLCIVVPCHRVTSASGVGGYAHGMVMKQKLLQLEGAL